ncbi:hypothetical protein KKE06_00585, partial [Candidatus Micrarchaeota archaeon]|nr:hypothetical protein [Candidatus Micrarchaeota archaeon]MBU1930585.1 hypothetical protein [Candidatus Micrarchaeota archaeon]
IYAILIYKFYHFVARRDVFGFDVVRYHLQRLDSVTSIWSTFLGIIKYGLVFPVFVFIWFAGFSILLFIMAKNLPVEQLLLVSITFVTAIRVCSYYTEDLSRDLAKMIPFALLGIAIVEPNFFSLALVEQRIDMVLAILPNIVVYFVFIVLVEWVLRILLHIKHGLFGVSKPKKEEPA